MTTAHHNGLANFRDLGGLPTGNPRATRSGVLYRSDAPLPGDTPPEGVGWPPAVVIDLRSGDEPIEPHPLRTAGTLVHHIPLMGEARPRTLRELREGGGLSFDRMYRAMVERVGDVIASVLEIVTGADGPVLVHCAAGKDRTGVLVATLLRAVGVTREAVIADYVRTAAAMHDVRRRMVASDAEVTALLAEFPDVVGTPADAIALVLAIIDGEDGGVRGWLARNGVDPALLERWSTRMLGPR